MEDSHLLVVAMADECKRLILEWDQPESELPSVLQPTHLVWMCNEIEKHAEGGPTTKLHRWIGFIQCGMLANRILDLDGARAMFAKAKNAHAGASEDLLDHLDRGSSFELEIGGEG